MATTSTQQDDPFTATPSDEQTPFQEESLDEPNSSVAAPLTSDETSAAYSAEVYPQDEQAGVNQPSTSADASRADDGRIRSTSVASSTIPPPKDAIQIVDALKTSEGANASYIVYCIRFEGVEARRRYSDFDSLRQALCGLYPCYIVPPLPPKNSLSSYAIAGANPSKAKEDAALVNRRKRMLTIFLNRVLAHKVLGVEKTFRRFLNPEVSWSEVLHSQPVTLIPKNPLRAAASNPTDPDLTALFSSLPLPPSNSTLQNPDQRFLDSEAFTAKFSSHLSSSMEKLNRRLMKRWTEAGNDWGEMGGGMNGFALRMGEEGEGGLDAAIEKVGMAVDGYTLHTNQMLHNWESTFTEPLSELTQFSAIIKGLLKYRHQKHVQYEMTKELLETKKATLEELERSELEAQRLEKALERVRIGREAGVESQSAPASEQVNSPLPPLPTSSSAGSVTKRGGSGLLGAITHTFQGMVDSDPETTRRNSISKTHQSIQELDAALKALTQDLRYASTTIQNSLDRFQRQKVIDLKEMMTCYAHFHQEWTEKNLQLWEQAKEAILAIDTD